MSEHLGYEKPDRMGRNSGSNRNGTRRALRRSVLELLYEDTTTATV
jgi:hypothetical protein